MDALPSEVREALEQMPAVGDSMGIVWSCALADTGIDVSRSMLKGQYDVTLERAAKLAAASIRLVEYLNQDRP
jgi:hypothetical protein